MNTEMIYLNAGSECTVYKVTDTICFKKYKSNKDINKIYTIAKEAAELGIGPAVFGKFENGYYTEIVETPFNEYADLLPMYGKEYSNLVKQYEELIGKDFNDNGYYNFGLKNGKLIIVDFGENSQ